MLTSVFIVERIWGSTSSKKKKKLGIKMIEEKKAPELKGVIERLHPPVNVKWVRSILRHVDFYWHFIKCFSKIAKSLCNLFVKEYEFAFDNECL